MKNTIKQQQQQQQQKTTKFLAANTNYGFKIALLKHNDNQTYTFEFRKKKKKKIPTYRPIFWGVCYSKHNFFFSA